MEEELLKSIVKCHLIEEGYIHLGDSQDWTKEGIRYAIEYRSGEGYIFDKLTIEEVKQIVSLFEDSLIESAEKDIIKHQKGK